MRRIVYFLVTNLAVMLVITTVVRLLGVDRFLTANGLNLPMLAVFSLVVGFAGSIISLLASKTIAKMSAGVEIITEPRNETESWLMRTVEELSQKAKIGMPEVGIFEGGPNAFATGASKNSSLVAVSTGLLQGMDRDEVKAVLGHEIAHIANGDMVTMALLQGILNTFVVFISRVVAFFVSQLGQKDREEGGSAIGGMSYHLVSFIMEMVFGVVATMIAMYYSRAREFRADAGAANLLGENRSMIRALQKLQVLSEAPLPSSMAALGINGGVTSLFSSHPPLEKRIEALKANNPLVRN